MVFRYSIPEIAAMCSGEVVYHGSPDTAIFTVITDSRAHHIPSGALFVAIKGVYHNGHLFAEEMMAKGVSALLVSELSEVAPPYTGIAIIKVEDTLIALQRMAAAHRSRYSFPVAGITGSNGKTIVKEWLAHLLDPEFTVCRSPLSYNSQVGVPLSLLRMQDVHTLALIEAGISMPGEMERLEEMIRPTLGIFTGIGTAHDAYFTDRAAKTREKLKLFIGCDDLVCFSDVSEVLEEILQMAEKQDIRLFTIGYRVEDDLRILSPLELFSGSMQVIHKGLEFSFELPMTDNASLRNSMLCAGVMFYFGYNGDQIAARLKTLEPIAMRMEQLEGINRCVVINDSYNSDLISVRLAFEHLKRNNAREGKCMILSDILQTGLATEALATHIADLVSQYQPDKFIVIGRELQLLKGMLKLPAWFYETTEQFLKYHPFSMFRDEVILLKGARMFGFERIRDALQRKSHDTVLETNLGAVAHNLNVFRSLIPSGTKVMAMVKASSYGSGSFEIAGILQFHKADYLAVAYADEGVELRNAGIGLPIMVMSPEPAAFATMIAHHLEPEIYSFALLEKFISTLDHNFPALSETYPIHLEVDTGMNRLGFTSEEIPAMIRVVNDTGRLRVVSVFSHLATAGDPSPQSFAREQIRSFRKVREQIIKESGWNPVPLFHILNSDGIVNFPEAAFDMVRPGIGLYGFVSDPTICKQLLNASTLHSVLSQIREVPAGCSVGYNRSFVATLHMRVGIVAIGYADGFDRKLGNGNYHVRINGMHVPVIGDVCMDMLMVDLTTVPDAQVGDEVIIFDQHSPVTQMAKTLHTIPYEILTSVSPRVKRVYVTE